MQSDGIEVIGFMMRRGPDAPREWTNIDLGETRDAAMAQRFGAIFSGADGAARHGAVLKEADLILARNLDMLACAFLTKRKLKLATPVVYESLDVHRLLTRKDPIGALVRSLEGGLLKRCAGLVVSSPAFLTQHFEKHYPGRFTASLLENRMSEGDGFAPRPTERTKDYTHPLKLGWFGNLRCNRSFKVLMGVADQFGPDVQIILRGRPSLNEIPGFEAAIDQRDNVVFHGRYKAPEDLVTIYEEVDTVWSGDYMEAGFNSVWLLPNRLYEGGYFAVPPIAPDGTQTAEWIKARKTGFTIEEPIEDSLPKLIGHLLSDPEPIQDRRLALMGRPDTDFVQPKGSIRRVLEAFLNETPVLSKNKSVQAVPEHKAEH